MWTRFFPAMKKVSDVIASGEIGDVVNVQGDFGWSNVDCPFPEDRIWYVPYCAVVDFCLYRGWHS